MLTKLLLICF